MWGVLSFECGILIFPRQKTHRRDASQPLCGSSPAHNEAGVIGELIASIKKCEYPQELISIFVVADGCTDSTVYVAQRSGAMVVEKSRASNKGDALEYILSAECIKCAGYDCVAVFDADNIVSPRFFAEMNEKINMGYRAVQGYIDSKNPYSSWVSGAHSIWYWITNRTVQTGRARLGLGARLGGTGFVLTTELLDDIPWQTGTLAEDGEYTCILAEKGVKVDYAEKAVVYDEKPDTLLESVGQRRRWARGVCDVQGDYTVRLLLKGHINAVLGLWCDVLSPLIFTVLALLLMFDVGGVWQTVPGRAMLWLYLVASVLVGVAALIVDKKLNAKTVLNIFGFIIYMLSWIFAGVLGVFCTGSEVWRHTTHKRKTE